MTQSMLLEARRLKRHYPVRSGFWMRASSFTRAVDGVGLTIAPGKTLGLVGESGCGKSTLARLLLKLEEPDAGQISFKGRVLKSASREFRRSVQGVFQDPYGTLDPRFTIRKSMEEGLRNLVSDETAAGRSRRLREALSSVGLSESIYDRFPHEFSGGQRQRIGIARALVLNPSLLICDEPVSSLDVSVAAQIIALLGKLRKERCLSLIIISHHMGVVSALADDIAVMKQGRIVEQGPARDIIQRPRHTYTRALMSAIPRLVRA